MEFEIGIACGACDMYNAIGATRCTFCQHELTLYVAPSASMHPASNVSRSAVGAIAPPPLPAGASRSLARSAEGAAPAKKPPPPVLPPSAADRPSPSPTVAAAAALSSPSVGTAASNRRRPLAPDLPLTQPTETDRTKSPLRKVLTPNTPLPAVGPRKSPPSYAHLTQEELMEQARNYLCWQCYTPVPSGHKFCGRCGAEVPPEILNARTTFFSDMQNPAKARLILIRGEGMDGLSFHLKMDQHLVGRKGQIEFPDDVYVSPKHANFFYRDGKLVVRDEGSLNGVYLRVRGSVEISPGDTYLAGEQVFRLDPTPHPSDGPEQDGTFFYSSPKYPSPFRITQILHGGALGMTVCARGTALQLGREGGDLNFPADIYMSGSHCRIEENSGRFFLTDLNSRNGTYVRIKTEHELGHGDYLFIGRKLIRVELNT